MLWSRKGVAAAGALLSALVVLAATSFRQGAAEAAEAQAALIQSAAAESFFEQAIDLELGRQWQSALEAARLAVAQDPRTARYVDKQARLAGFLMLDALAAGDRAGAEAFATELLALEAGWRNGRERLNPATELRFGQAHFLLGDQKEAEKLLKHAARVGLLNSEAEVWLYALYESRGDTKAMGRLANQPWIRFKAYNPVYQAIKG